jgi:hypothetical protein
MIAGKMRQNPYSRGLATKIHALSQGGKNSAGQQPKNILRADPVPFGGQI